MNKQKKNYIIIPIITSILSLGILLFSSVNFNTKNNKSYNTFKSDLESNQVLKVALSNNPYMSIYLKDGTSYKTDNPNSPTLKEELLSKNISINENNNINVTKTFAGLLLLGSIITLVFMSTNKSKGMSSATSIELTDFSEDNSKALSFKDVAGNEEAKESLKEIVDFLSNPEKYKSYGARMPKGVILYGDPGTGKTLLAKAVAGEAKVPFYALSGSDFVQVYVGVGAARIRNLFKKARSHGKAVIFIDEIDAIGKNRDSGKAAGGNDERDQTLNALLTEMSGFGESEGVIVMAATNRLDILDQALLRPGRFDRHIEVALPDVSAREKIINLHLSNKPHIDLNIKDIAKKTSYFSGAKLENLINEAAILAAKDNSEYITETHIDKAYSIVLAGHEKLERSHLKESDLLLTSYHEVGHALTSLLVLPEDEVSKISIIPTTKGAGGYTLTIPEDTNYQRADYLKKKIMVMLGGRAAEEIIFGKEKITTGASSDLTNATNIAMGMISEYGMGETLGLLKLSSLGSMASGYSTKVIEECKDLINSLYDDTLKLLNNNKELLEQFSIELLEKETLKKEEIDIWKKLC
ncbi:ATP-dependent metallopeptidase FtsH/Yme1/Tma family protein [Clostridium sp.]|uniref:ATP-dependent metallopeptidase FtsH/Yme1/Tma family protein n=1 Tax=Clostridium sp. TaxID=1506 RepID=UPI001D7B3919|nr:ATP-dependent metallopeptidase FtsH/Yme1/Tma family protein [Clostridium sp.]MBS5985865.1 AAA family ATPase [Clostridium sp.]